MDETLRIRKVGARGERGGHFNPTPPVGVPPAPSSALGTISHQHEPFYLPLGMDSTLVSPPVFRCKALCCKILQWKTRCN